MYSRGVMPSAAALALACSENRLAAPLAVLLAV